MGREMVASPLPPLRIWKSDAEGKPGVGAIDTGVEGVSVLPRPSDAFEFGLGPGFDVSRSNFDKSNFLFLGSILPNKSGHFCLSSARPALTVQPSAARGILMIHDWRPWASQAVSDVECCRRVWRAFLRIHDLGSATFPPAAPHREYSQGLQQQHVRPQLLTREYNLSAVTPLPLPTPSSVIGTTTLKLQEYA